MAEFWIKVVCRVWRLGIVTIVFMWLIGICDGSNWTGTECTFENKTCLLLNDTSVRFVILGDWGGEEKHPYTSWLQQQTASTVNNFSQTAKPHFYLSTGDNFYERGVKNVKDKRFKATFENVFTYGKKARIPWYITAGNHDYFGNIKAQLQYSKLNSRWIPYRHFTKPCRIYPSLYYPIRYAFRQDHVPEVITTVDIFVIDTIIICGGTILGGWNSKKHVYVKPSDRPTGPKSITAANESINWLENNLQKSTADFVLVMGHYPIYSTGRHGDTVCLKKILPDMLLKHKVNAYIAGHDHQLQHLTISNTEGWTVHHVISGAASRFDRQSLKTPRTISQNGYVTSSVYAFPNSTTSNAQGGFVYAYIKEDMAAFEYYQSDGTFLYAFTSRKRN